MHIDPIALELNEALHAAQENPRLSADRWPWRLRAAVHEAIARFRAAETVTAPGWPTHQKPKRYDTRDLRATEAVARRICGAKAGQPCHGPRIEPPRCHGARRQAWLARKHRTFQGQP